LQQCRLLHPGRERPRRRTAEKGDEIALLHSSEQNVTADRRFGSPAQSLVTSRLSPLCSLQPDMYDDGPLVRVGPIPE